MTYLGRIVIDRLTPSQNELRRRYRNKHAYAKLRDEFASWIMVGMANGKIPRALTKRELRICRFAKGERYLLDRGNFVGGCKPLLDAAILRGLIVDDREQYLEDTYQQRVDGKYQRTEVDVYE